MAARAPRREPVSETVQKYLRKSISLSDIMGRLLRGWMSALIGAVLGIAAGIYVVWVTPPSYTVTITLLPLDAGSADLSGGGGFGLSVLNSILGSSGPVPKFTRFVASLYSTGLAAAMDRKYDIRLSCVQLRCARPGNGRKSAGFYAWITHTVAGHRPSALIPTARAT